MVQCMCAAWTVYTTNIVHNYIGVCLTEPHNDWLHGNAVMAQSIRLTTYMLNNAECVLLKCWPSLSLQTSSLKCIII